MLLELSVENFGIIDYIRWRPTPGLNILTGETGAGKSLIIDAIEALVGKRVGEEVIRAGTDHARIEGVFELDKSSPLKELLKEQGFEAEENIILTREIEKKGRSFNRINGHSSSLHLIQEIGRTLIDIHGQSKHLSLNEPYQQLLLLDRYANANDLRSKVETQVGRFYQLAGQLRELTEDEHSIARRADLLNFEVDEITKAAVHEGEDEELNRESTTLANVEKLKSLSHTAYQALYGGDIPLPSALDRMGEAIHSLKELAQSDSSLKNLLTEVENALYQIEEASHSLRAYQDRLTYDPARLDEVEQRLDLIRNLKRKYGNSIAEIIQYAKKAEEELQQLNFQSERRTQLQEEYAATRNEIAELSCELSKIRHKAATELAKEVEKELTLLNMAQVGFQVLLAQFDTGDELTLPDGHTCAFTKSGIDRAEFLITTNPGEPLRPLAKIASTGETSRLMLAIKSALSRADATPTLIFDEIDIGIGGRSGEVIGRKLSNLSRNHQVICITHLPQVAVFAEAHYSISKDVLDSRTVTTITPLSGKDRLDEISAMLGSLSEPTALDGTQELLSKADAWKKNYLRGQGS